MLTRNRKKWAGKILFALLVFNFFCGPCILTDTIGIQDARVHASNMPCVTDSAFIQRIQDLEAELAELNAFILSCKTNRLTDALGIQDALTRVSDMAGTAYATVAQRIQEIKAELAELNAFSLFYEFGILTDALGVQDARVFAANTDTAGIIDAANEQRKQELEAELAELNATIPLFYAVQRNELSYEENRLFQFVNEYRQSKGLNALLYSEGITAVSKAWSDRMAFETA